MLTAQITECQECRSLKKLLKSIDCSLQNFGRNKLNNEKYNVETYYCSETVLSLHHYKRILTRRMYSSKYLQCVSNQDLITQVKRLLFGVCKPCITCDDSPIVPTTPSSSTTT